MLRPAFPLRSLFARLTVFGVALSLWGRCAHAQPALGFVENFPGISTSSWSGGSINDNPGTGGFGGPGDGYLDVKTVSTDHLGTVSFGPEYAGNWSAAGITQVRCWLKDIGGTGDLEIHLSLGDGTATFQQNAGFVPPGTQWAEYVVNLVAGDFTRIHGVSGTLASVMLGVDRLHYRHDLPPFTGGPDLVMGDFGLDHILLTNGLVSIEPGNSVAHPVLLAPPYPNPARGRVTFQIQQPESRPVRITILDAAGRQVRDLELPTSGSAPRLWLWDGNDDSGRAAPAGVYRVLARGVNGGMSRTVTLLR